MGVDFYACNNCGETFPDCGDYVGCECGYHWCSDECAEVDGYVKKFYHHDFETETLKEVDKYDDECNSESISCKYCREEDFDDYELLRCSLSLLNLSRSELVEQYKKVKHLIK